MHETSARHIKWTQMTCCAKINVTIDKLALLLHSFITMADVWVSTAPSAPKTISCGR